MRTCFARPFFLHLCILVVINNLKLGVLLNFEYRSDDAVKHLFFWQIFAERLVISVEYDCNEAHMGLLVGFSLLL